MKKTIIIVSLTAILTAYAAGTIKSGCRLSSNVYFVDRISRQVVVPPNPPPGFTTWYESSWSETHGFSCYGPSAPKRKIPAVGSIQNPRWSNYKDNDYRKSRKSRPKLTLELNFYKKKKQ